MAKKPIKKKTAKVVATVGTTAALMLTMVGFSIRSQANRPEIDTEDNSNYSETISGDIESDIHTVAPEDTLPEEDFTFEEDTIRDEDNTFESESETESNTENETVTSEENTVGPIEDDTIITPDNPNHQQPIEQDLKTAFANVINAFNNKLQDFYAQFNRENPPIITGIENIISDQENGSYTFTFKIEGSEDNSTLKNYKVTVTNSDTNGSNLQDIFESSNIDNIEFLNTLYNLLISESSQITGCKQLNSVTINNESSATQQLLTEQKNNMLSQLENLDPSSNEYISLQHAISVIDNALTSTNPSIDIYMDFNPQNINRQHIYTCSVVIKLDEISYLGTIKVTSTYKHTQDSLNKIINQILSGDEVEQPYTLELSSINNSKIHNIIENINNQLNQENDLLR